MPKEVVTFSLRVTPEVNDMIQARADAHHRSKSAEVAAIIDDFFDSMSKRDLDHIKATTPYQP